MISSPSYARNNVHEEIETLSVYNCIFCNKLLNGKAKILECLHVACYECLGKKVDESGLKCKCLTVTSVTNDLLIDYPIVSPSVPNIKQCDFCDLEANKYCIFCKQFYCELCLKVHFNTIRGRSHNPDLVMPYPMPNQFVLCSGCFQQKAEVYCTHCSMMICHLCLHLGHNLKILNELQEEIKIQMSEELDELEENDDCLKKVLDRMSKVTQKLETKKESVLEEINKVSLKLHHEINKRSLELKELVEHNFKYSVDTINDNGEILQDIHKKLKYDINFMKTVMEYNNVEVLRKLSKTVSKKLEQNKVIFASTQVLKLEIDIKLNGEESIDNCITAIKNAGNVTVTPVSLPEMLGDDIGTPNRSSDGFINLPSNILNDNHIKREEEENMSTSSVNLSSESESSEYEPLVGCSCCNQWGAADEFIQCNSCARYFHHECHIPKVPNVHESSQTKWKCTLCKDLNKYAKVLNQRDMNGIIPVGTTEFIIMERILMELYCQNDDSEHFRELPDIEIYPVYYQKVSHPLSLNDVKKTLESNPSYTSLIQFLLDLKKVFFNGLLYYSPYDPYYKSAANLQIFLQRLINRWIPKLRDDTRLHLY